MQKITIFIFILTLLLSTSVFAQTIGDYRTKASGNWSPAAIWERYNGSSWTAIGTPPTGTETITVQSGDSVFVNVAVSISDTLINQGIVEANGMLTIADSGVYEHARNAGGIPISIWAEGSTLLMSALADTAPNDRDQDYYNITFNTPGLLANLNMNLDSNTVSGDIRVINTGVSRWYLTTATANDSSTVTLMGDVIVENGMFATQGTSNANTKFTVHHYGNIIVTGGNFSLSRGSQTNGTTTWYLHEGNFSMSNATTQSSTSPADNAKFVFCKAGTQILTLGDGVTLNRFPIEVASGTTLDMGSSALAGTGQFILKEGATLMTALPGGIDAILSGLDPAATVNLSQGASYGFNGTSAQVTSVLMPDTVTNLTINNAAGVTLSQATTINGVLHLVAGVFDNTIPFILGPNGSISFEGGSLLIPVSVELVNTTIPETFFVEQNYPNPFNPATRIRFGLPSASQVTVKIFNISGQEVAMLFNGHKTAGVYELEFDATNLSSGVYFYQIQAGSNVQVKRMLLLK